MHPRRDTSVLTRVKQMRRWNLEFTRARTTSRAPFGRRCCQSSTPLACPPSNGCTVTICTITIQLAHDIVHALYGEATCARKDSEWLESTISSPTEPAGCCQSSSYKNPDGGVRVDMCLRANRCLWTLTDGVEDCVMTTTTRSRAAAPATAAQPTTSASKRAKCERMNQDSCIYICVCACVSCIYIFFKMTCPSAPDPSKTKVSDLRQVSTYRLMS